ncbi:MAG: LPS export ABC transporter periplasmic protein LptC [Treponema sp.]|nr:LPS export ABC transporter periplasmic protein LptC [Treponema sp.]
MACSFDYGDRTGAGERDAPDIVMENVEYVRVRSAEIQARFLAERAERFEDRRLMELRNFSFEQFEQGDVNAFGRAGSASVELDSLDIFMANGVRLEVESEEIAIETVRLEWRDGPRILLGGGDEEVHITRDDGTAFAGVGFRADARQRTWEFSGAVIGTYVHEDEDEEYEVAAYGSDEDLVAATEEGAVE